MQCISLWKETSGITQQCFILFKTERRKVVRQYRKMAKQNRNKNDSHFLVTAAHALNTLPSCCCCPPVRPNPTWCKVVGNILCSDWAALPFAEECVSVWLHIAAGCCPWIFVAQVDAPSFSFFCTRKEAHLLEPCTTSNRRVVQAVPQGTCTRVYKVQVLYKRPLTGYPYLGLIPASQVVPDTTWWQVLVVALPGTNTTSSSYPAVTDQYYWFSGWVPILIDKKHKIHSNLIK